MNPNPPTLINLKIATLAPSSLDWLPARVLKMMALLVLLFLGACTDEDKVASEKAGPLLERLLPLVERDCKQIRDGMPKGAVGLGKRLEQRPSENIAGIRRAIASARAGVHNLVVAKSTFFMFVDTEGRVLRTESDPDLAATHSLFKAIPETKRLARADAGVVEAYGFMKGLRGVETGSDLQWVLGVPVTGADGTLRGSFVTGWSFRRYANYLEQDTRRHISEAVLKNKSTNALVYIFLVKGKQAYGAPVTPEVNTKAVTDLDIVAKLAQSSELSTFVEVERRRFAVRAKPLAALGPEAALVVMLSKF